MRKKDYGKLAAEIIEKIGGKDNISTCYHCVTRLRFDLKDRSRVDDDSVQKIDGVLGTKDVGGVYQIIIGNEVDKVYDRVCAATGLKTQEAINEYLDEKKPDKLSLKGVFTAISKYLSQCVIGILPLFIAAGMIKTIQVILGPDMAGLISAEGDLYILLGMLYDTTFYFMPVFLSYSAAKALKYNPVYGLYIGALIILPSFIALLDTRETFHFFGIPGPVADYSRSFLPVILGAWIMKYVLKGIDRISPKVVKNILVPLLTVLIMTPVMFAICCPLGSEIGNLLGIIFGAVSNANVVVRTLGYMILTAIYPFVIMGGMHGVLINIALISWSASGFESFIFPVGQAYTWGLIGVIIGTLIKYRKNTEERADIIPPLLSSALGGVSEPGLYGVILKYPGAKTAIVIAGAVAGLYCGIAQPLFYTPGLSNIFTIASAWAAGGTENMILGIILSVVAVAGGIVAALFCVRPTENRS